MSQNLPQTHGAKTNLTWWGHLIILTLGISALCLSFVLNIEDQKRVSLEVAGTKYVLPESCMLKSKTTLPCPGCGLTRSFCSLSQGRFVDAAIYNPLGPVAYVIVVIWSIGLGISLVDEKRAQRIFRGKLLNQIIQLGFLAAIAFWPIRVVIELYERF